MRANGSSGRAGMRWAAAVGVSAILAVCGVANAAGIAAGSPCCGHAHSGPNEDHSHGLPHFDIRVDENELPTAATTFAINESFRKAGDKGRSAALQMLRSRVPGVTVDLDPVVGTPSFVRSTVAFLTEPRNGAEPRRVVADFLDQYAALMDVGGEEVEKAAVRRNFVTKHNGLTHLTFQQQHEGVDLFNCIMRTNVTADGRLLNVASLMLPRPAGGFAPAKPVVSDLEAIRHAAAFIGITVGTDPSPMEDPQGPMQERRWNGSPDFRAEEPVKTKFVYFPFSRTEIRPAWHVVVPQRGIGHTYDVVIDATNGQPLWRHNWLVFETTQPATYRVYTSNSAAPALPGSALPDGTQFPFAARSLVTVPPASIAPYSPNGWIPDGSSETLGNNVAAHLDIDGSANVPDLPRPNGGATRTFDFALDHDLGPTSYRSASVTQLFYWCNWYHDRLYAMGFDEAAGNFQTDNFGRGGVGGDAILADCQDGSGTNNANFSGSTDGSTARIQMYLWTGPAPDRDGSLDGDIVVHELTHGTSIRLHEATLSGTQARAMGEGWSDFFGLCLFTESTDDPNGVYPMGAYATYQLGAGFDTNYYFGIRRFPCTTDMNKAPQTYADTDTAQISFPASVPASPVIGGAANGVHNAGEIWNLSLWQCRANLWALHGPSANDLIMQLVVDGMKIAPANPNMIQERDAILQADLVNNASANLAPLWSGFAQRGLGEGAASPGGQSTTGVVESFQVPFRALFSYPDGRPAVLIPGVATNIRVAVQPFNLTLVPNSGQVHYSVNGGAYATAPMTALPNNEYTATLPGFTCLDTITYYVSVDTSVGRQSDPRNAPGETHAADVFAGAAQAIRESFETDTGWLVGPNTATAGIWTRGDPNATTAQPEDDVSGDGVNCWYTGESLPGAAVGTADIDGGSTVLTSRAYNLQAYPDAQITYSRWFSNGQGAAPYTDTMVVEVSSNGGNTWTTAEIVGPGSSADPNVLPGWRTVKWRMSTLDVDPSCAVKLRFTAGDLGTGSIVEAALDEVTISGVQCGAACGSADFNGDCDVGTDADIEAFFACLGGSCCSSCGSADFDGDGDVGTDDDIEAFFRVLAGGTC